MKNDASKGSEAKISVHARPKANIKIHRTQKAGPVIKALKVKISPINS
jgi:hypothetical protein